MAAFRPTKPTGNYLVTGVAPGEGEKPGIRLELRELKKNKDLWNLYLLGLWQFQLVPKEDQLSYFQIAGIHGLPYQSWPLNDPNQDKLNPQKRQAGFCTHSSILFLTWHRPYLALFESVLHEAVVFVANQFTEEEGRAKYVTAAKNFRMPFWDWARPGLPVFPDEATISSKVQVTMPKKLQEVYKNLKVNNGTVEIDNPLFSYQFPDNIPSYFKVHELQTTTRYHPRGIKGNISAQEQQAALLENITPFTRAVNQELPVEGNLRERLVYLLKSYEVFDQVSHNQWDPNRVPDEDSPDPETMGMGFGSIEDIHNTVHGLVGGFGRDRQGRQRTGHMSSVPISAFDPIFWLHHTNIDRVVSMWEGLRPDLKKPETWVTSKKASRPTWVTASGNDEGLNTPLAPFYKEGNNFWTSDQVRNTATFGYAYPETKSWNFAKPEDFRKDIEKQLATLYPSGSLATMIKSTKSGNKALEAIIKGRATAHRRVDAAVAPSNAVTALSLAKAVKPATDSPLAEVLPSVPVPEVKVPEDRSLTDLAPDDTYLEWLVNIKAVKHTLNGNYQVHVFLGRVPEDEPTILYSVSPYHVGTFSPLGQSEDTACGKCQSDQEAGTKITGQIPLTIALVERYFAGELDSLGEADVIKYLQTHLHWEVVDGEGQRLQGQRDAVEGLLVGVASNKVTLPPTDDELPQYSPTIKVYPEVTTKEDGSSGRAEGTGITQENKFFHTY